MYALKIMECDIIVSSFRDRFLFLQHEKGVSLEQIAKVVNSNKASLSWI